MTSNPVFADDHLAVTPYRFLIYDIHLERLGEPVLLVPTGDKHIESATAHRTGLQKFYHKLDTCGLKVAYMCMGDASDLILPSDVKRFESSTSEITAGKDARLNITRDHLIDFERGSRKRRRKWLFRLAGNHEHVILKRHSFDILGDTCYELSQKTDWIRLANHGQMESPHSCVAVRSSKCRVRFRFFVKGKHRGAFDAFFIHGRWGGQIIKGMGGALRMFNTLDSVRLFCFGHGHQSLAHKIVRDAVTNYGKIARHECYVMQTGTWKQADHSEKFTYSVNYPPVALGNPVIRAVVHKDCRVALSPIIGGIDAWI